VAWDDTKKSGDVVKSTEWNAMVTDQKARLKADGSVPLTSNWDLGEDKYILAEGLKARDVEGITIVDDAGIGGITVKDGGDVEIQKVFLLKSVVTIPADDTTPDVSTGNVYITSANTGATEITDLDNPAVGAIIIIIGGSDTNSSTITDGGNFNLQSTWTASLDESITLYVQADNDYIELSRSTSGSDPNAVNKDGSVQLTGNWDIGEDKVILAEKFQARDAEGLTLVDDAAGGGVQIVDGGNVKLLQVLYQDPVTIPADDTTPDVSTSNIHITSANTGATEITDLDNPVVGSKVTIIGGSDTNSSTITDGGNFNLQANWTASLDAVLVLYIQADNDYIEVTRVPLPTGIDAAKIADGTVSNAEYQYLNSVTSDIQTQLNAKAADADVLKKDGSVALTSDWDIGDAIALKGDEIKARDAAGLKLFDDGGNGITISDGGNMSISHDIQIGEVAHFDSEYDNGSSGSADTITWGNGNKQKSTLTANCTYTFVAPGGPCNLVLKVVQDATGGWTVTWPGTVKWADGIAPTLSTGANDIDIVSFYYDGTNYYGAALFDFS